MRVYEVSMNNVAVTGAITLVQLKAGTASILRILRAWCSQSNLTASAQQTIEIVRKSAAATVTSFTPLLNDPGDKASNMVSGVSATGTNASAEGSDGDILYRDNFSVLNGWLWVPTPEERIIVGPSGIIGLKFPIAPASSMTTSAGFIVGEEGG
jgi:hypothetical protein